MNVKLIHCTPEAEKHIAYCARVSSPKQDNPDYAGLIKYCIKHKHWSILEMASMCIEVTTSRAISAQIIRHDIRVQEFCISGDSKISCFTPKGKQTRIRIDQLYKKQFDKKWSRLVKVFNEKTNLLEITKVKEVFKTGLKEVFLVTLTNGKTIKTTKEHKFYTREGFKPLNDLFVGQIIATNGNPLYQNFEWLQKEKEKCIKNGTGVNGIAVSAGVSYHTIRKWLKILKLGFSKKEVAEYTEAWNKGLPKEQQPRYGKLATNETRKRHSKSAKKGTECNLFKGGIKRDWRQQVFDWQYSRSLAVHTKFNNKCVNCNSTEKLEIDHILPVSQNPELAFEYSNLQLLCSICHKKKSIFETKKTIKWTKIESIVSVGFEQTYDLEVEHDSHNYVANGIIVHNSQRYSEVNSFEISKARRQDTKNRQNSIDDMSEEDQQWFLNAQLSLQKASLELYNASLEKGVAKELARMLLPMSTQTKMYLHGTLRNWIHYLQVRCDDSTQLEHREVANEIKKIFIKEFPVIAKALEWC